MSTFRALVDLSVAKAGETFEASDEQAAPAVAFGLAEPVQDDEPKPKRQNTQRHRNFPISGLLQAKPKPETTDLRWVCRLHSKSDALPGQLARSVLAAMLSNMHTPQLALRNLLLGTSSSRACSIRAANGASRGASNRYAEELFKCP